MRVNRGHGVCRALLCAGLACQLVCRMCPAGERQVGTPEPGPDCGALPALRHDTPSPGASDSASGTRPGLLASEADRILDADSLGWQRPWHGGRRGGRSGEGTQVREAWPGARAPTGPSPSLHNHGEVARVAISRLRESEGIQKIPSPPSAALLSSGKGEAGQADGGSVSDMPSLR